MSVAFLKDCLAAFVFLARARIAHHFLQARDIERLNEASERRAPGSLAPSDAKAVAQRIGWFIAKVAHRLPWRSDCLIQAMAAQEWLTAMRIPTRIVIGVDKPIDKGFLAHAWLMLDDTVVTGGNVDDYTVLLDGRSPKPGKTDGTER